MKSTLPIAAVVISLLLCSCSLASLIREETKRENARVHLKDGTILMGKAVLPNLKDKHICFFPETGGRKRFKSGEIDKITYWQDDRSEIRNIFVYREFSNKSKNLGPFWMKTVGSGTYIDLCLCGAYYSFNDKGEITVEAATGDRLYITGFKDSDKGVFIGYADGSTANLRNSLVKWLSDDPVLCGKLIERDIPAKDYETICKEYNPQTDKTEGTAI